MMSITRLCFSMLLFVLFFMLLSFWVIVTKNRKQDTTISLSVGSSPPNTTEAIVYIVDGEQTSIIPSSSQHNINQTSEPSFSHDLETTEDSNDGFTTVTSNDKVTDSFGMTKVTGDNVQLENLGDPTAPPTPSPSYMTDTSQLYHTITTYAGTGSAGSTGDGGAASSATLYRPQSIVVDTSDRLYIADIFNHKIR